VSDLAIATLWMPLAYHKQTSDWSDLALFETIIKFTWEATKKMTEGGKQTWSQVSELHRLMMAQPWRLTMQARRLLLKLIALLLMLNF
jgi:hypothetical protein